MPASPVHAMAYDGDVAALRNRLLRSPSELHLLDRLGDTLLHIAVRQGQLAVVRLLLESGFDVNTRSASGWTVLEEAHLHATEKAPPDEPATGDAPGDSAGVPAARVPAQQSAAHHILRGEVFLRDLDGQIAHKILLVDRFRIRLYRKKRISLFECFPSVCP